jgi:hypothetical protein
MSEHEMDMFEQVIALRQRRTNALERLTMAQARIAQVEMRLQELSSQRYPSGPRPPVQQALTAEIVLPASGDLELQASFSSGEKVKQGTTDRMVPLRRVQTPETPLPDEVHVAVDLSEGQ